METSQGKTSVLMLPWLAHGHISPFLELAKKLSERNFHIYFCSTPIILTSIKKTLPEKYYHSIQLLQLQLPSSSNLPPHYHTTNGLPPHLMAALKTALEKWSPNFSNLLETLNPDLVICDFNQPWIPLAAFPLRIPAIMFLTFGALFTSFYLHGLENPGVDYPFKEIYLDEHGRTSFQKLVESSANDVKDKDLFLESLKLSGDTIWVKTSREIEGKYIDYLSVLTKKKIQPVGPLVQEPSNSKEEDLEVMQFLDKKDKFSCVFVSFGSEYFLSYEEIEEIAHGLELSMVNFIWVVRFPVGEKTRADVVLLEGFKERVGERGLVIEGWAPQGKILAHPSTGGFVSHCGWGSVLESFVFGIPIIAIPMHIDQPLNARVVEKVGAGLVVKRDTNGKLDGEEIARAVRRIVVGENGMDVRRKVRELSENIAIRKDEDIDELVEEVAQLCGKRK